MQIKEFVLSTRQTLSELYSAEEAGAITGALCCEYLGVESYTYMVNPGLELKDKQLTLASAALDRLMTGEPLQYVLGFTEFHGRRFKVNQSVLIPRPETELLCRHAIEHALMLLRKRAAYGNSSHPVKILDLCTGSGCIAWTMAVNVPGSIVVGVDISSKALEVASSQNLELQKGFQAPHFVQADILDEQALAKVLEPYGNFDMIISNPPYVMESEKARMKNNVLDWEPSLALFVPDYDPLLFYKKIAEICVTRFNTDSEGIVEINEALGGPTAQIFADAGFSKAEILKDLSQKNRFVRFSK